MRLSSRARRNGFYEQAQPSLVKRLNNCLDSLSKDPFANPSSKPLRGALSGYYRCGVATVIGVLYLRSTN
jgi:Txe/YoeB family toxin of Txe-Axe toxin-antitoxin module